MFCKPQMAMTIVALCFFGTEIMAQQVIAQCGSSFGMRYQLEPQEDGWQIRQYQKGRFACTRRDSHGRREGGALGDIRAPPGTSKTPFLKTGTLLVGACAPGSSLPARPASVFMASSACC